MNTVSSERRPPAAVDDERAGTIAMLRDSAQAFARGYNGGRPARSFRKSMPGYDPGVATAMAEMGWFGLLVAEEFGGSGLGFREMAVVLEELSAQLLAEPLSASVVLAGGVLASAPPGPLRSSLLSKLADGAAVPALAWQESMGQLDDRASGTSLQRHASGYRIEGRKCFVAGAGAADGFIVSCTLGDEHALVWMPADDVQSATLWRADGVPLLAPHFDGQAVAEDQILCIGAEASAAVRRALTEATVMVCAELVGLSRKVMAMTLDYMRTRMQYGRHIGSFQALQHRAVDLLVQQELSGSVLDDAISMIDSAANGVELQRLVSRAKARCSDAALRITREAIQLHGAIGYTDEHDLGLYLKRALVLAAWLGNSTQHRARFLAS